MKSFKRSLKKKLRYLTGAKVVEIDGVRLISDKRRIPAPLRNAIYREVYEDTERNVLLTILKPGQKVLELGTGLGFITLLASKICGASNVHTYEANPKVEKLIRANFSLNDLYPELHMNAVTEDGKSITFNASDNIISSSFFDRGLPGKAVTVESYAFTDVVSLHNPDVLIMDIEGGEYDLLTKPLPLTIRHIVVELHPHIIGVEKIEDIKESLKRDGYIIGTNDRKTFHFYRG
jgi:FkbM family methyltransferase